MIKDCQKNCSGGRINTSRGMRAFGMILYVSEGKMRRRNKQIMRQYHQWSVTPERNVFFMHIPRTWQSPSYTFSNIKPISPRLPPPYTKSKFLFTCISHHKIKTQTKWWWRILHSTCAGHRTHSYNIVKPTRKRWLTFFQRSPSTQNLQNQDTKHVNICLSGSSFVVLATWPWLCI